MDTQKLLHSGLRGLHLLFDTSTISEAFDQDVEALRALVEQRLDAVHEAVDRLLELPDATSGRRFIAGLPRELQYVMVLLYFELLDGQMREGPLTVH